MSQNSGTQQNKIDQEINKFTLDDGRQLVIRPIQPDDADLLVELFNRLSDRSKRLRFHGSVGNLSPEQVQEEAETLANINPQQDAALVATLAKNETEQIVAVVRFSRAKPTDPWAEIAMVVRDDVQNQGLGTYMTKNITQIARSKGVQKFIASIIPGNRPVRRIFERLGLLTHQENFMGETRLSVDVNSSKK